jgi:hypothetical protein
MQHSPADRPRPVPVTKLSRAAKVPRAPGGATMRDLFTGRPRPARTSAHGVHGWPGPDGQGHGFPGGTRR